MLVVKMTRAFEKRSRRLLSESELADLIADVGFRPEAGDVIPGGGGVRKLRWGLGDKGKRGGARVLYLYLRHAGSLWLLDIYAKSEKTNLSAADMKALRATVAAIKAAERPA